MKYLGKNKKGFTLIELIVVIAILAILAAIAIPAFMGITDEADAKVKLANARNLATAINTHNMLDTSGDNQLTSSDLDDGLKAKLDMLYPDGLSDDDATAAMDWITFGDDGVAIAAEQDAEE